MNKYQSSINYKISKKSNIHLATENYPLLTEHAIGTTLTIVKNHPLYIYRIN